MNKQFFVWWCTTLLFAVGGYLLYSYGVVHTVFTVDTTYLTSVAMVLFIVGLTINGLYTRGLIDTQPSWFITEQIMGVGMLGTVIGLIHMMTATSAADFTNAPAQALGSMWGSMGIALYTNAVGIGAGLLLKAQTFLLDRLEHQEQDILDAWGADTE